jgi:hypothetical protein
VHMRVNPDTLARWAVAEGDEDGDTG